MIGMCKSRNIINCLIENITRNKKIIQFPTVKITHSLNTCKFHLDSNAALAFSCIELRCCFSIDSIRCPDFSLNTREFQFIKYAFYHIRILYLYVISRRRIMVTESLLPVAFRRNNKFSGRCIAPRQR